MTERISKNLSAASAAGIGLLLLLTGCAGSGTSPTASTAPESGSAPATAPATAPVAPSVSPSASAPATAPASAPVSKSATTAPAGSPCTAARLTATLDTAPGAGAAGSTYRTILLTNSGTAGCTLEGFPTVTYGNAALAPVGRPAIQDGSAGLAKITLGPGGTATVQLRETRTGFFDEADCKAVPVTKLLVTVDDGTPLAIDHATDACTGPDPVQLQVGPYIAS